MICNLSPQLFNLYTEVNSQTSNRADRQYGIKFNVRFINNIQYADGTLSRYLNGPSTFPTEIERNQRKSEDGWALKYQEKTKLKFTGLNVIKNDERLIDANISECYMTDNLDLDDEKLKQDVIITLEYHLIK